MWNRIMNYKFLLWKLMVFLLGCLALCIYVLYRII